MTIADFDIKPHIEARILAFLNKAQSVKDFTQGSEIIDDPATGHGYTIGATVAQRIIDLRDSLPHRHFRSIGDLDGIKGLGTDKVHDLIFSFGAPAAEAFRKKLFEDILHDGWEIRDYTTHFDHEASFLQIVNNTSNFRDWAGLKYSEIRRNNGVQAAQARQEGLLIRKSFMEVYDIEHYGAIALAFWFYQFDADNWFTFDRMRQVCEAYLGYYPGFEFRQELRLFKGYKEEGLRATSITRGTLPVVVNYAEQAITIWEAVLNN